MKIEKTVILTEKKPKLSYYSDEIIKVILKNKKVLIVAPVGKGKTYLMINYVIELLKKEYYIVYVIPNVGQIEQMSKKYPSVGIVCNGANYVNTKVTITTPDSMPKVIDGITKNRGKIAFIIDEAHEKVTSYSFRQKFSNIAKYEPLAAKVIHLTATPQPLIEEDYDETVVAINKVDINRIPVKIVAISNHQGASPERLTHEIIKIIEKGGTVQLYNDDKVMNEHIEKEVIKRFGEETVLCLDEPYQLDLLDRQRPKYKTGKSTTRIAADRRKGEIYERIVNGGEYPQGLKLLITTSAFKAGIDIFNPPSTYQMINCNKGNFNLVTVIQQIGRNRNLENLDGVSVYTPYWEEKFLSSFPSREEVYQFVLEDSLQAYDRYFVKRHYMPSKAIMEVACVTRTSRGEYIHDMDKVRLMADERYNENLLCNLRKLKEELEASTAINLEVVEITKEDDVEDTSIREEIKAQKEAQEEKYEQVIELISTMRDDDLIKICNANPNALNQLPTDLREPAAIYHNYMPESYKKRIKEVSDMLCEGDKTKAQMMILKEKPKEIKKLIDQEIVKSINNHINIKNAADDKKEMEKMTWKLFNRGDKLEARTFYIRGEFRDIELKQGRLSKKRVKDLAEKMMKAGLYKSNCKDKEKSLEKAIKKLNQDLNLIYNIVNDDKGQLVSSVKLNI